MSNIAAIVASPAPRTIDAARAQFPQRDATEVTASPADWRDEVLYFLLPDRFSDGREATDGRPLLQRSQVSAVRAAYAASQGQVSWNWQDWRNSGGGFRGGPSTALPASSATSPISA